MNTLFLLLVVLFLCDDAACTPTCNNQCCRFVEGSPVRLRRLRQDFAVIRDYYEAEDDLEIGLLDQSIAHSLRSPFGCHAMKNIIDFYLKTVLPTAIADMTEENKNYKPHIESIQLIFDQLKNDMIKCKNYFQCKKPFEITQLNSTYTQMEGKGPYKAIGELDLLFNFIEMYLGSKRRLQ
uniref:Interleukin family protein n=1 Tax=Gadus morhua TaxID=8049 RepID=B0F2C0_GADMO|nr:interleukin 10 precursor [Gadus morhua]